MEKFILVETCEREIGCPKLFATHEAAFQEMCERVADVLEMSVEEIVNVYNTNGGIINDDAGIFTFSAFCDTVCSDNSDWSIFAVDVE